MMTPTHWKMSFSSFLLQEGPAEQRAEQSGVKIKISLLKWPSLICADEVQLLILCVQFVYLMYFIFSGLVGLENCLCPSSTANQNYLQVQLN